MFAGSLSMLEFTVLRVYCPKDRTSLAVDDKFVKLSRLVLVLVLLYDFSSSPQPREISGSLFFASPKIAPEVLFLGL